MSGQHIILIESHFPVLDVVELLRDGDGGDDKGSGDHKLKYDQRVAEEGPVFAPYTESSF